MRKLQSLCYYVIQYSFKDVLLFFVFFRKVYFCCRNFFILSMCLLGFLMSCEGTGYVGCRDKTNFILVITSRILDITYC